MSADPFWLDDSKRPADVVYTWKAATDARYDKAIEDGWSVVPQDRHPEVMVAQRGMVLMEKPARWANRKLPPLAPEVRLTVEAMGLSSSDIIKLRYVRAFLDENASD